MTSRIVFFGASVTAQDKNHRSGEISGYVTSLQAFYPEWVVDRVAYGSSQYSNMGKHGLVNAILKNPSVLFIEWHTTCETYLSTDLLLNQYALLKNLGIEMVILVLPTLRHDDGLSLQKYEMLNSINIPILDLRHVLAKSYPQPILRDEVHTTPAGAKVYADHIHDYLVGLSSRFSSQAFDIKLHDLISMVSSNPNLLSREIITGLTLRAGDIIEFSCNTDCQIIFSLTRGPLSPNSVFKDLSSGDSAVTTWVDQWSYYDRSSTGVEWTLLANQVKAIEILEEIPRYDLLCPKLFEPEYSSRKAATPAQLELKINSIFVSLHASLKIRIDRAIK
jgi:hypothetical protein